MERNNIICIDFETGGLDARKNPITQVAVQSFDISNLKEISRYKSYVQNYDDLEYVQKALDVTGITMKQINQGLSIQEVVKDLIVEFKKANTANSHTKKPVLLGHNVGFDISFLQYIFKHCKEDLGKYINCQKDYKGDPIPLFYDTMLMARLKWGGDATMTSFTLASCCEKAGVDLIDAHDAHNDVTATRELFEYFVRLMRQESDGIQTKSISRIRDTFEI
jgi:DNA polymerase III alpha subunit (gram-positive type)